MSRLNVTAIYKHLKPIYELQKEILAEHNKHQVELDNLYKFAKSFPEIQTYIDENLSIDEIEFLIHDLDDELKDYEKRLEKLYNEWKFTHFGEELFVKLDGSIFDVTFIEEK